MNLADLIRLQAAQRAAKIALRAGDLSWTYADVWRRIAAAANDLTARGVKPGDRIGVCLGDTPEHVVYHYAIAALGACLVPIDHRGSDAEIDRIVTAFGVQLLLLDADRSALVSLPVNGRVRIDRLNLDVDSALALTDLADEPWLVSLSSGTTGQPKGALVTHRQMRERFVTQWVTLGFNTADRFALVTPLVFGAGRSFAMSTLAAGAELVLAPPPLSPEAIVAAINDVEATATFLVPTLMRRLLALPGDDRLLPGLRRLLISGEAFFPSEVAAFRARLSTQLIGYYASSEGGGVSVLQPDDFDAHGASVGQAAFGVDVDIVDADRRSLPAGEAGELRYRGPGVTTRALAADGTELPGDADGWFYPGDLAVRDHDGFIALRGRAKDIINRAGVNIYPLEIEHALLEHVAVREAAVVGYRAADGRDQIAAFVVADANTERRQIGTFLETRLAPYKQPKRLAIVAELPRAKSGKTDKQALTQMAEAGAE